ERQLRVRRQRRMAAGEDEAQAVVLEALVLCLHGLTRLRVEPLGELVRRGVEARPPADTIDRLEAARGHQPCARVLRDALPLPLLDGRGEGLVERLLGEVEVAEQADEGREDTAR